MKKIITLKKNNLHPTKGNKSDTVRPYNNNVIRMSDKTKKINIGILFLSNSQGG